MEPQVIDANGRSYARVCFAAKDAKSEVQILPPAGRVSARDGRAFMLTDPHAVVRATELPVLVDWEHASEYGNTRAAGWIHSLEVRASGTFGRVEFTPQGRADIDAKAYAYISPSLLLATDTNEAQKVLAVALTNRPALNMQAISAFSASVASRIGQHFTPAISPAAPKGRTRMAETFCQKYNTQIPGDLDFEPGVYASLRDGGMTHESIVRSRRYAQEQAAKRGTSEPDLRR